MGKLVASLLVAAALFSFSGLLKENTVAFSNDSAYGQYVLCERIGNNMLGVWNSLNWIGSADPAASPNITGLFLLLPAKILAKIYAPMAVIILGLLSYCAFHLLGCGKTTCFFMAFLAAFNPVVFGAICWGLPAHALAFGFALLAIGFLGSELKYKHLFAGTATGLCVSQGLDIGALLSLTVGGYALSGISSRKDILKIVLMVLVALLVSAKAFSVFGTNAVGASSFDWARKFCVQPSQLLSVFLPIGEHAPEGSVNIGIATVWLVIGASLTRFSLAWGAVFLLSLLLSLGDNTPLFGMFYSLPFTSMMRCPAKFLYIAQLSALMLASQGLPRIKSAIVAVSAVLLLMCQIAYAATWVKYEDISGYDRQDAVLHKLFTVSPARVAFVPFASEPERPALLELFTVYRGWLQKDFQYRNIHSLDVIQERAATPDRTEFDDKYSNNPLKYYQDTNTEYLLGTYESIRAIGENVMRFDFDKYGTSVATNGRFLLARIETKPRAYFESGGRITPATIATYMPKRVSVAFSNQQPGIFVLNDRWHKDWKATLDGRPVKIEKFNTVMRSIQVTEAGSHIVTMIYQPSIWPLAVSAATTMFSLSVLVWLLKTGKRTND